MWEKLVGPDSPELAPDLNNLGAIYEVTREKERAEPLFLRAASIDERSLGADSPELGTDLNNLGLLYLLMKRYPEAVKVYERALAIRKKNFGESDAAVTETLNGYNEALHGLQQSHAAN
jgi:tetratricopeptide (TPR) repeat protein